jgi:hypothetical protein
VAATGQWKSHGELAEALGRMASGPVAHEAIAAVIDLGDRLDGMTQAYNDAIRTFAHTPPVIARLRKAVAAFRPFAVTVGFGARKDGNDYIVRLLAGEMEAALKALDAHPEGGA